MTISLTPSGIRFHEYTDPNWPGDLSFNINRLNTTLLKLSAMGDVNLTSLQDKDALKWDATAEEYTNFTPALPTTTSTTSTTTTTTTSSTATISGTTTTLTITTTTTSSSTTTTTSALGVTWDSANKGTNIILTGNDLIAGISISNNWGQVIATEGKSSGKWYFEVDYFATATNNSSVGVQNGSESLESYIGDSVDGWGWLSNARFYNSSFISLTSGTFTTSQVSQVAVDMDAGKIWIGRNNVWIGSPANPSPNPSTGTDAQYSNLSGTVYPAVAPYNISVTFTGKFTAAQQTYTAPVGFTAWGD